MDLQKRVTNILTTPKTEWPVIAAEPTDIASLYRGYIAILAAIPAIGTFLFWARFSVTRAVVAALVQYIIGLASAMIAAVVIEKLAPKFNSSGSTVQALKLVAYASTPTWIAGIFNALPFLYVLVLLIAGLYAVYLFYLGLPPVMKTPPDQVVPFMVVAAIVVIVISIVLGMVFAAMTAPAYYL
jgi:hypothetical protein